MITRNSIRVSHLYVMALLVNYKMRFAIEGLHIEKYADGALVEGK